MRYKILYLLVAISLSFFAQQAFSQALSLKEQVPDTAKSEKSREGWTFGVDVGATTNWNLNRKYVGIADGHYFGLGGKIGSNADFRQGIHEWRNNLSWLEIFNLTPTIDGWLKSADLLSLETKYLANFSDWWGYFAAIKLNTSTFSGIDRRPADVKYVVEDLNKNQTTTTGRSLTLTKPFQPLYLQESTGLFARILDYSYFTWKVYAGPAARENFAADQLIIAKDASGVVSAKTLRTTYQLGPVLGTTIGGTYLNNRLSYEAGAETLYAFLRFPTDNSLSFSQRLNVDIYSTLSFKFYSWMALAWDLRAIRIPDILEDFQLQNNVLLTFSYRY